MTTMDKKRILLIRNPVSGKGGGASLEMAQKLTAEGHVVAEFLTSQDRADDKPIYLAALDYDIIVCCGGDGTLNSVVNGLMEHDVMLPVLYAPTGTTNDLAKSLCLPDTVSEYVRMLGTGVSKPIDLGLFNKRQYFCYIASIGAFTDVSYTTPQKMKNWLGHAAYVLQGIVNLPSQVRPIKASFSAGEKIVSGEFLFCSISNSTSIGGLISLKNETVLFDDGLFEVMLVRNPKNARELHEIANALMNHSYLESDESGITFFQTSSLHIETETEVAWTLDGEYGGLHKSIDIEVVQGGLQLILP